jgi:hypothetical protein
MTKNKQQRFIAELRVEGSHTQIPYALRPVGDHLSPGRSPGTGVATHRASTGTKMTVKSMTFVSSVTLLKLDPGFNYAAIGNSTNKKDAQGNAARDFAQYLVRTKEIQAHEVPGLQPAAADFGANQPPSGPPPG